MGQTAAAAAAAVATSSRTSWSSCRLRRRCGRGSRLRRWCRPSRTTPHPCRCRRASVGSRAGRRNWRRPRHTTLRRTRTRAAEAEAVAGRAVAGRAAGKAATAAAAAAPRLAGRAVARVAAVKEAMERCGCRNRSSPFRTHIRRTRFLVHRHHTSYPTTNSHCGQGTCLHTASAVARVAPAPAAAPGEAAKRAAERAVRAATPAGRVCIRSTRRRSGCLPLTASPRRMSSRRTRHPWGSRVGCH